MKRLLNLVLVLVFVSVSNAVLAKQGGKPPPSQNLKNVITVSATGGDYINPVDAVNDIGDSSTSNPYLVRIGPGVYVVTEPIVLKEGITLQGSGVDATKLIGCVSNNYHDGSSIINGASDAAIMDLNVVNQCAGVEMLAIAIYNYAASPLIARVEAMADGADDNYGIYNTYYAMPKMTDVTAYAPDGTAVHVDNSSPFILDSMLWGRTGLYLETDSTLSRIVDNMIIGGVLPVTYVTGDTPCRGNYNEILQDVNCWSP